VKAIDDSRKEEVKRLLLEGCSLDETAMTLNVSLRTVNRIKKELAEEIPELAQVLTENKYNRSLAKREEKFVERIKNEQYLFEDKVEGWTYHLTAEELRHKESSKWWCFIVYPESAPSEWKKMLIALGCELAISPLHDKDEWTHDSPEVIDEETGEILEEKGSRYKAHGRKKAHYHNIIKFDRTISFKEANKIVRDITNGPYLQKCLSLKGQYEYFIHLNNPDKYPYEKDEIERYNGFIVEATATDRIIMIDEIGRVIRAEKFTTIEQVRQHYEGQYEYINVISLKCYYFEKLTQVNYRELYPEGRTQKIRLVKKGE
jgi:transposase